MRRTAMPTTWYAGHRQRDRSWLLLEEKLAAEFPARLHVGSPYRRMRHAFGRVVEQRAASRVGFCLGCGEYLAQLGQQRIIIRNSRYRHPVRVLRVPAGELKRR